MDRVLNARYIESEEEFASKSGEAHEYQVEIRVNSPFTVVKNMTEDDKSHHDEYEMDDDDVMIRGAVYVGNEAMLDRHGELVDMGAIMSAWDKYQANHVILYNHSKSAGVIGRMVDVSMEKMDGMDEEVPFGRAIIDGGEKDIVRKIRKGLLRSFSIGFIARAAVKECKNEDTCYIRFTEIDWLETSVVDVPASPNAQFSVEKHIIGYEDMGDKVAILFGKAEMDSPSEEPPIGGDMEAPEEMSATESECECKSAEDPDEADEHDEITPIGTFDSDLVARLELIEAHLDALESKGIEPDTLNTPLAQPAGQRGNEMTQEEIKAAEELAEEVVVKTEEEASEEPVVEEATEELSEEVVETSEEVVEEVAEATEEESFTEEVVEKADEPSTNDILIEVVKTLAGIDERIAGLEAKMVVEDLSEEVAALKAELEVKDAELAEFKAKAEEMAKEAEIEAEVSKRIAERIGDAPAPAVVKTADPKSLSPVVKEDITRHDPQPEISKGMNGLAVWLEKQLIAKRGA